MLYFEKAIEFAFALDELQRRSVFFIWGGFQFMVYNFIKFANIVCSGIDVYCVLLYYKNSQLNNSFE